MLRDSVAPSRIRLRARALCRCLYPKKKLRSPERARDVLSVDFLLRGAPEVGRALRGGATREEGSEGRDERGGRAQLQCRPLKQALACVTGFFRSCGALGLCLQRCCRSKKQQLINEVYIFRAINVYARRGRRRGHNVLSNYCLVGVQFRCTVLENFPGIQTAPTTTTTARCRRTCRRESQRAAAAAAPPRSTYLC